MVPWNKFKQITKHKSLASLQWFLGHRLPPRVNRKCNDLVPTAELLSQAKIGQRYDLGIQQVPIEGIVGSGRWRDFDLSFSPKRQDSDGRWLHQAEARQKGSSWAPVQLLKINGRYFVVDGNHRISVAKALGHEVIKARVLEVEIHNLQKTSECQRLGFRIAPLAGNTKSCQS